ncbi:hypothetical protein PYCCODRAFT_1294397 [Trametes coccinea BRFM310]|uniref:Uncharacterized protein n=1 Tax=Trametes coccinea (strain BRFM310) TaxID=1353009 RepID=A0A1Y2IVM7_TRAC3|nr:hypothetical protein PYCCODRAFT_1294397 [Trametes coccinea BRFM310]
MDDKTFAARAFVDDAESRRRWRRRGLITARICIQVCRQNASADIYTVLSRNPFRGRARAGGQINLSPAGAAFARHSNIVASARVTAAHMHLRQPDTASARSSSCCATVFKLCPRSPSTDRPAGRDLRAKFQFTHGCVWHGSYTDVLLRMSRREDARTSYPVSPPRPPSSPRYHVGGRLKSLLGPLAGGIVMR